MKSYPRQTSTDVRKNEKNKNKNGSRYTGKFKFTLQYKIIISCAERMRAESSKVAAFSKKRRVKELMSGFDTRARAQFPGYPLTEY